MTPKGFESSARGRRDRSAFDALRGAPARALRGGPEREDRPDGPAGPGVGVVAEQETRVKKPSLYKVLLLNDDYTPMEFVVYVLERYFGKDHEEAKRIMLRVHNKGVGVCGVYTYEVAETKVAQVMELARQNQHPLQCTMEQE